MEEKEYEEAAALYLNDVYRLAYSITRSEADAQDAVQNTFMKLAGRRSFESGQHMKNWLLKCAANESKSMMRSFWKKKVSAVSPEIMELETPYEDKKMQQLSLDQALSRLNAAERTVIHLYYWQEYSTEEIAEILSMTPTAVTTRLYRARRKLKKQLEGEKA